MQNCCCFPLFFFFLIHYLSLFDAAFYQSALLDVKPAIVACLARNVAFIAPV